MFEVKKMERMCARTEKIEFGKTEALEQVEIMRAVARVLFHA